MGGESNGNRANLCYPLKRFAVDTRRCRLCGQTPTAPVLNYLDERIPLRWHEHVAVLHQRSEGAPSAMEFISDGLRAGQRCFYLGGSEHRATLLTRLRQSGLDLEKHQNGNALQFPPDLRRADHVLDWASQCFAEAEAAGAPAVRWLEQEMWAGPSGLSPGRFFALHCQLNYLVKHYPIVALCYYDKHQIEVPHLFHALTVHRHLVLDGVLVRDNPFYIPPEKYVSMKSAQREHGLRELWREMDFDLERLLSTLAGYGQLQ